VQHHGVGRSVHALYTLGDDQFTVTSKPIVLHDFAETVTQDGYQAGVGKDGTVYIPST